jgi:hypothetical protein
MNEEGSSPPPSRHEASINGSFFFFVSLIARLSSSFVGPIHRLRPSLLEKKANSAPLLQPCCLLLSETALVLRFSFFKLNPSSSVSSTQQHASSTIFTNLYTPHCHLPHLCLASGVEHVFSIFVFFFYRKRTL